MGVQLILLMSLSKKLFSSFTFFWGSPREASSWLSKAFLWVEGCGPLTLTWGSDLSWVRDNGGTVCRLSYFLVHQGSVVTHGRNELWTAQAKKECSRRLRGSRRDG